ncbi:MAG: hypothetical protein ABIO70_07150 [Pseudomonadota bacterium]
MLRRLRFALLGLISLLWALPATAAAPADVQAFLNDVFARLPAQAVGEYTFQSWEREGRPTSEGFGLLPVAGVNPGKLIARVMDVDHYKGNIAYVEECRTVADPRFSPPATVRFYQRLDLPMLGGVQHSLVLVDGGTRQGYRYAYWYLLGPETEALDPASGARSAYSMGAWIAGNGMIGYALSNAPRREDVSWAKWQAMTTGADMSAKPVVKANIEGMAAWASR